MHSKRGELSPHHKQPPKQNEHQQKTDGRVLRPTRSASSRERAHPPPQDFKENAGC